MAWIIEHKTDTDETGTPLVWSNAEGWTCGDDFETFSDEERDAFALPLEGKWVRVAWEKQ